ncbi:unnamed protein product [Paramecium pentaurelia]|uniref:Uncharacterized protein n=1 Tax=Paramecium pentaurelia TaxID=43138 RepID=A0A8S1WYF4_9CILI|nr:unnamed protein product [Paramecium pentaurelia]
MITQQQTFCLLFLIMTCISAQKPCGLFIYDEVGCVSSTFEKCSWNDFLSACQATESNNIGCSATLNRLACINQLQYPNQDWAYCRFSGYCREITGSTSCSSSLSKPACLAVVGKPCQWQGFCLDMTGQQFQEQLAKAQTDPSFMNQANISICQSITGISVVHQSSAFPYIIQLIDKYGSDNAMLNKYKAMLAIPGCFEVDVNLLNLLSCTAAGLNSAACKNITTPGMKCKFQNGQCVNVTDFSNLLCQDNINKEACLSITNIKQPCFWSNGCQLYTGTADCNIKIQPVSPSFCAAINYVDKSGNDQECFYYQKKQKCSELCRSKSLQVITSQKSCNSSSYNCVYQNNQCLFKGVKSQCGLLGQNQFSCMNVNENCQFVNGICRQITDLSTVKCGDNLNKQACQNIIAVGQVCKYDKKNKKCGVLKLDFFETCENLQSVNENACRRITDSACYWVDGNCKIAVAKVSCTTRGLNRIGCLQSNMGPCQWSKEAGMCQNVNVVENQTSCESLKLVNEFACRMVSFKNSGQEEHCKYNPTNYSCQLFQKELVPPFTINCITQGLNKRGCLDVIDPTIACKWTSLGCTQLTSVTSACSGLVNVTAKACALITGEVCGYDETQTKCTTSITKTAKSCTQLVVGKDSVLNGNACAFIEPEGDLSCYFDTTNLQCSPAATQLNKIYCGKSFPNKFACLSITTQGQRCQWNTLKRLCEEIKMPTYESCEYLTDVNDITCLGYENDVEYYISEYSFCTKPGPTDTKNKCIQYVHTLGDEANCFSGKFPNLHACVAKTEGQNCYFNTTLFQCLKLEDADKPTILDQIMCKQANKDLCLQVTTNDQNCQWDDTEKKCYNPDKCSEAFDATTCKAVSQPCVFVDNKCILIKSSNVKDYKCADANDNEKACYKVAGESCSFVGGSCNPLTQDLDNDICTTYTDNVNAVSCAKIQKEGEKCKYNKITHQCISTPTQYAECNIGQNEQNCLQENSCEFNQFYYVIQGDAYVEKPLFQCKKIDSSCQYATSSDNCMQVQSWCVWDKVNSLCLIAPNVECLEYNNPNYEYSSYTCGSVWASIDTKICAQNETSKLCEEIVAVSCKSTTDSLDCKNVKADCKFEKSKCIQNLVKAKVCSDNYTQYACLTGSLFCQWDLDSLLCKDSEDETEIKCVSNDTPESEVEAIVSAELCYWEGCYLKKDTLKCTSDTSIPTECSEAVSPFGCKSLPDEKYCYWDIDSICKSQTDLTLAKNLTYKQVANSQRTLCLSPQNEGELTEWWEGECYSVDSNVSRCQDDINIRACEAVLNDEPIQLCIYKDNKCQYADPQNTLCTDTINVFTCVAITTPGQFCIWLGQQCSTLKDDGFPLGKYSNVNSNTCTKTYTIDGQPNSKITNPIGVKFGTDGCIQSDPLVDLCDTPGLNYYGCLQTKAGACTWNGSKCVPFTQFNGKIKCSDYLKVSAGVCEQVPSLKCTWNNFNCIDATNQQQCTDSLSQEACVQQITNSCQWLNNKCMPQNIITGVTSCGDYGTFSTAEYSSVMSCQMISFGGLPCRHTGKGCTTQIDLLVAKCNSPGLNDIACTMITLEKCIYLNGQCQIYQPTSSQCRQLINVSPQVCADISDSTQLCKFSKLNNKCVSVYNYDLCSSPGINEFGCNSLSVCKWHKDEKYCTCSSILQGVKFCADYDYTTCKIQSQQCLWDDTSQKCRAKLCSDLSTSNCTNVTMNNQYCYVTSKNTCRGAKTCNEVRNVTDCTKYLINGQYCQPYVNDVCRIKQCIDNLTDAQCNGSCYWTGSYCAQRLCQTFTKKEQCMGTYEDGTCFWFNGLCIGLDSCYKLQMYYDNPDNLKKDCNTAKIMGNQCYWQRAYQYADSYECSHNQCKPLGSSKINCVGTEINDHVCILSQDFQCLRCEDVVDRCECSKYSGNCYYSNNKCNSIQCAQYVEDSCALFPDKCIWHSGSKMCLIICAKLDQKNCEARQSATSQCYWDSKLERCNSGLPSKIVIDTVTPQIEAANITITTSSSYSQIAMIFIGLYLLD